MKKITVEKNNSEQRIDKFLVKEFFSYTRGEIIRQIKNGNVLANGKKTKPSYILKENDELEINLEETSSELLPNKKIKLEIIFQDENIVVVNKPAGLQVHPDFHEKKNTLVNALINKFPEIKNVGENMMRPGIVHRLDKDTSGVIIIARNQKTFVELKNKFKNREVEKKYWAIVYRASESGRLGESGILSGVIEAPIARSSKYRKQVIAGKKTKTKVREAVTKYRVLKEWNIFSLLEVTPKTGRMHQIRVHLTSIGHPIVGDKLYKNKTNRTNRTNIIENRAVRQMLHAKSIRFNLFGEDFSFEAQIPEDFNQFLTSSR
ncbi:MAG: RluA family pseudouridine synthase [Parcubacteria group bacterium]|jgi:23S rRNA pseudouridine1911/1915/1917 synthase